MIVSLYAKGMSVSDIEEQIREVYNFDISESIISRITDAVTADIIAWGNRPLEPVYLAVRETTKKWSMPIQNWGVILNQFLILYEESVRI